MGLIRRIRNWATGEDESPREVWECQVCKTTYDMPRTVCTECGQKSFRKLDPEEAARTSVDVTEAEPAGAGSSNATAMDLE